MQQYGWKWQDPTPIVQHQDDVIGPLTCWVEYETAGIMWKRLHTGFRLGLYAPHEYAMIYWYCEYLLVVMMRDIQQLWRCRPALVDPSNTTPGKNTTTTGKNTTSGAAAGGRSSGAKGGGGKSGGKSGKKKDKQGGGKSAVGGGAGGGSTPAAELVRVRLEVCVYMCVCWCVDVGRDGRGCLCMHCKCHVYVICRGLLDMNDMCTSH